jgi:hypothetical protein
MCHCQDYSGNLLFVIPVSKSRSEAEGGARVSAEAMRNQREAISPGRRTKKSRRVDPTLRSEFVSELPKTIAGRPALIAPPFGPKARKGKLRSFDTASHPLGRLRMTEGEQTPLSSIRSQTLMATEERAPSVSFRAKPRNQREAEVGMMCEPEAVYLNRVNVRSRDLATQILFSCNSVA